MGAENKKILSLIGVCWVLLSAAFPQDGDMPHTAWRWQHTNQLLQKLYRVEYDTFVSPKPPRLVIEIGDGKLDPAAYINKHIILSDSLFNACSALGEDSTLALAFILSHELAHHYQRKEGKFACVFSPDAFKQLTSLDSNEVKKERQADIYGHYAARLAGFSPCKLRTDFMDSVFSRLRYNANGAFPLALRKQLIANACQAADTLVLFYETATYLSLGGEYELATLLYSHIYQSFPNENIHYALAVNQLAHIREHDMDKADYRFDVPLLPDFQGEIRHSAKSHTGTAQKLEHIIAFLQKGATAYPESGRLKLLHLYARHLYYVAAETGGETHKALLDSLAHLETVTAAQVDFHNLLKGVFLVFTSGQTQEAEGLWQQIGADSPYRDAAQANLAYLRTGKFHSVPCPKTTIFSATEMPDFTSPVFTFNNTPSFSVSVFEHENHRLIRVKSGSRQLEISILTPQEMPELGNACKSALIGSQEKIYWFGGGKNAKSNYFKISPGSSSLIQIH